jgi:hypothetical protein
VNEVGKNKLVLANVEIDKSNSMVGKGYSGENLQ